MGDKTGIGWTNATWTTITGCTRVSPGCGGPGPHGGCYAEGLSAGKLAKSPKYVGVAEKVDGNARWTGLVRAHADALDQPLRWKKPRRIFVNSMSDTFHQDAPDEFIAAIFGIMAACPQHTFQILTKRAERLPEWFAWIDQRAMATDRKWRAYDCWLDAEGLSPGLRSSDWASVFLDRAHLVPWPLPNVWLGVSVEDQQRADERIPHLLRTPAAVRWVSAEPLLGPVDLSAYRAYLDWVVIGGESGPRHRPMDPAWLASIVDQCRAAGVPAFVKQDSGARPGKQSRIPDDLWAVKDFPA